jgi:hypothetical protein
MLFTKFIGQDGQTMYRPSTVMAGYMTQDKLAFCAYCTQNHEDIAADAYRTLCSDCGEHKVFGHLNFNKIA